jgi:membrane protein DedA with SNARE-associated domain
MMLAIQQITAFVSLNSFLAGPLSFLIAFCGGLVGTSLVVPAGAILTALGVLTGAGVVSWTFILWAICGVSLGMSISYSLGLLFGSRLQRIPMLQSRPELTERARSLFERYGSAAILIGYYAGPLRAIVASVAAILGMPRGKFETANVISAVLWVVGAVSIGAMPGTLFEPGSPWLLGGVIVVPLITIGLTLLLLRAAS